MDSRIRRDLGSDRVQSGASGHRHQRLGAKLSIWLSMFVALILLMWVAIPPVSGSNRQQPTTVQVSLVDGAIEMPDTLPAGMIRFEVTNNGTTGHNFEIGGPAIQLRLENNLLPGQSGVLEVELTPGEYQIICPVDSHAAQGMQRTLTVVEADAAQAATPTTVEEEGTPVAAEEGTPTPTEEEEATPEATEEVTEEATEEATAEATEEATAEATEEAAEEAGAAPVAIVATPGADLPGEPAIQLVKVADGLIDPVNVTSARDGSGRLFVVERNGVVRIVTADGQLLEESFLDIQDQVLSAFLEQGLYDVEFHPNYAENGRFFVHYADVMRNGDGLVVEYHVSADNPDQADLDSARLLLQIEQPWANHNGGELAFGPDGYLYIGSGDGGWEGDPLEAGQDLKTLLGKVLRIDVDVEDGRPYGIPEDNPFYQEPRLVQLFDITEEEFSKIHTEARQEIWAYGLRNPWKFQFDRETGDLYLPDVGQNQWEEINVQPADSPGGENYGWDFLMGAHCFPIEAESCSIVGELPVAEYSHESGNCAIIGIGVYRGDEFPALNGLYLAGDYCSGRVWGLMQDPATSGDDAAWMLQELVDFNLMLTGAGEGEDGTLYVTSCQCTYESGRPQDNPPGALWRVVAADAVPDGAVTAPQGEEVEATPTPVAEEEATPAATEEPAEEGATGGGTDQGEVVTVSLVDGAIEMPDTLPAGLITFEVTNNGTIDHNFEVEGGEIEEEFSENLKPGESKTMAFEVPSGEYRVYCPVANHAQQGMELTLTVQ